MPPGWPIVPVDTIVLEAVVLEGVVVDVVGLVVLVDAGVGVSLMVAPFAPPDVVPGRTVDAVVLTVEVVDAVLGAVAPVVGLGWPVCLNTVGAGGALAWVGAGGALGSFGGGSVKIFTPVLTTAPATLLPVWRTSPGMFWTLPATISPPTVFTSLTAALPILPRSPSRLRALLRGTEVGAGARVTWAGALRKPIRLPALLRGT